MIFNESSKTPITEGGEGFIYEQGDKIIKTYKTDANINFVSKERKITSLIKLSSSLPKETVLPIEIVQNTHRQFIGYTMEKVAGEDLKKLSNKKFIKTNNITTKDILEILVKIKNVIDILHKNNVYIGDLNDQNILFDKNNNVYFIDCDSWTVENEKCEVAMDLFKDPLLKKNDFNKDTDTYSFAILAFKILTRIHPFGGTMSPDINIVERMQKGIHVIDNKDITVPKFIKDWSILSPQLLKCFKNIFENKTRTFGDELNDLLQNLSYCKKDKEYYYSKYSECPICNRDAKVIVNPKSQGVQSQNSSVNLYSLLSNTDIRTVINNNIYIDNNNNIVNIKTKTKLKYQNFVRYYFAYDNENEILIEDFDDYFIIHSDKDYRISKKYKSLICVEKNNVYYISDNNTLTKVLISKYGNDIKSLCKCSNTSYFDVCKENYCVLNYYDGKIILNINGYNTEINFDGRIKEYGLSFDVRTSNWLIILENDKNKFFTYIIDKNTIKYKEDKIKYQCQLSNVCIYNTMLFIPVDSKIRAYSYIKNIFKDFECNVVDDNSKLIKISKNFTIINDNNIYSFG